MEQYVFLFGRFYMKGANQYQTMEDNMYSIELWKDREQKKIDPKLFSETAEEFAREIGQEDRRKNKGTQLRRFFDEIVRLNSQAQAEGSDWDTILPLVHMIVAKAAYAQGRRLVTRSFVDLIKSGINQIKEKDDLQVLTNFMESFMGFYKIYGPK